MQACNCEVGSNRMLYRAASYNLLASKNCYEIASYLAMAI